MWLILTNSLLFGDKVEGEMGSDRYSHHSIWGSVEVYTWAGLLTLAGNEWRDGGIHWGELQLRLSHLKVDGCMQLEELVLRTPLVWRKAQFSNELWHGCQVLSWCRAKYLSVPEYAAEHVKRHLAQAFNVRSENSHVRNFNLGHGIVNKPHFFVHWTNIHNSGKLSLSTLLKTTETVPETANSCREALGKFPSLGGWSF